MFSLCFFGLVVNIEYKLTSLAKNINMVLELEGSKQIYKKKGVEEIVSL
jgi:hypothetical protein